MAEYNVGLAKSLLKDGELKQIEVEGKTIVLARVDGQYYAFGGKCTHYGAPLDQGALSGYTVMCPWHHACFDIRSGTRLEPPALNDLPHYPVHVRNGTVSITFPHENVTAPHGKASAEDRTTFLIIGGGAAMSAAAEELRRAGFSGHILVISASPDVPIDRPNLSKDYLDGHAKPEWMPLRSREWYAERDIELLLETQVIGVDPEGHQVMLSDGRSIKFDKLLLATGAVPRRLPNVPGGDLQGIYTLRTLNDANQIIDAVEHGKQVVIVGASFIGMEVAAALASGKGASVTVVGLEDVPFATILGTEIGQMFQHTHEEHGVHFCLDDTVTRFIGEDGFIQQVELRSGRMLDADLVIIGIGVIPATAFLQNSGLELNNKDHAVKVSGELQTSHPDIYAAGDIARWNINGRDSIRIEHWRVAQQQGIIAARNMLGEHETMTERVPFFWTSQWGITLNYVGHAPEWDEIIYRGGSPQDKKFMAFYIHEGQIKAAAGCGYDTELAAIELILRNHVPCSVDQLKDETFDLVAYAQQSPSQHHTQGVG
ncbi:MAG: FAD-dependent oxidoreductase [Chloroflexi bacterium]|nr:FAD-dependent oxidoreductase [Chloroflexota bacterium]